MTRLTAACALALALALPAGAVAAPARSSSGSQTYLDSTGELAGGPDVTGVTVSNDDAGLLTFQVAIPGRPTMASDMGVVLYLNTDRNTTTGNTDDDGAEYAIAFDGSQNSALGLWTGSDWNFDGPQTTLVTGYSAGTATIRISRSELGNVAAFDFYVAAFQGDAATAPRDYAPDANHGDFTYTLSIAPPVKAKPAPKPTQHKKKHKKRRRLASTELRVHADAGWTETGIVATAGQTVSLSAVGRAFTVRPDASTDATYFHPVAGSGRGGASGPAGQPWSCTSWTGGTCLVEGAPFGELVGRIGSTTFAIGAADSFVAPASGPLELAVNDAAEWLFDNSGGYTVALVP